MNKKFILILLAGLFPMLLQAESPKNILIGAKIISIDLQLKDRYGKPVNWDKKEIISIQRAILDIFANPDKYINQGEWGLLVQEVAYGTAVIEDSTGKRQKLFVSYWKTQKGISISTKKNSWSFYVRKGKNL